MRPFKIAAAQVPSIRGDIEQNVEIHLGAIATAALHNVSVVVFPELSLTGYEPDLAAELAIVETDRRLAPLAALARAHQIEVVVGAPLFSGNSKPALGAILFTAGGAKKTYRKMHLGGSEPNFFVPGDAPLTISARGHTIGIAICADASQPSHPELYANLGAGIYAAGVFLNAEWYATDAPRLAKYASRYRLLVLMANQGVSVGTHRSVGKSAIWTPDGAILVQAEGAENSLLIATSDDSTWRGEIVPM